MRFMLLFLIEPLQKTFDATIDATLHNWNKLRKIVVAINTEVHLNYRTSSNPGSKITHNIITHQQCDQIRLNFIILMNFLGIFRIGQNCKRTLTMDQCTSRFDTRGQHCIKGKQCQPIAITNKTFLCVQSSLVCFPLYANWMACHWANIHFWKL